MSTFLQVCGVLFLVSLLGGGGWVALCWAVDRYRVWRANRQGPPPIGIVARFDKPRTLRWRKVGNVR